MDHGSQSYHMAKVSRDEVNVQSEAKRRRRLGGGNHKYAGLPLVSLRPCADEPQFGDVTIVNCIFIPVSFGLRPRSIGMSNLGDVNLFQ